MSGCNQGYGRGSAGSATINIKQNTLRSLTDDVLLMKILSQARDQIVAYCDDPTHANKDVFRGTPILITGAYIFVSSGSPGEPPPVYVIWDRPTDHFKFDRNYIASIIHEQDVASARAKAAEEERQQAQEKRNAELAALAAKESKALADCGAEPAIEGGPWFSSTYKVGALDQARTMTRNGMSCVKTIEYVRPSCQSDGRPCCSGNFRWL